MYLVEWHTHSAQRRLPEEFSKTYKQFAQARQRQAQGLSSDFDKAGNWREKACDDPDGGHSVYEMNDTYIELRTPFDEKRGMVTAGALSFLVPMVGIALPTLFAHDIPDLYWWFTGQQDRLDHVFTGIDILFMVLSVLLLVGVTIAAFYFGWKYWRLEAFVQRRLLVRFNRKTRKVYVHRPGYAGGVVALDWEECLSTERDPSKLKPRNRPDSAMPLILTWPPDRTGHDLMEMIYIGRWPRRVRESLQLWEFIRRYMEEGPESVPQPKRLGRFPWPWKSVSAALSLIWPLLSGISLRWTVPLLVLISPAIAIFATAQWVALLTCWEPVWPKAIRQACEDGAWPWLRDRLIDLGAWAMLAALVWVVLRGVYGVG
ncbi:MAG: DUF6708 domain-containing protein [Caldimonas sp.]|uniref:DUF6708 domain-containing protein n=1 Tax=Caldimonas sp. TaxID=2838790 RepID=UPI00391AA92C